MAAVLAISLGLVGAGPAVAVASGLLLAHTANFLVNGQFWVCARYCAAYRGDPERLGWFVEDVVGDLRRCAWLDVAVCIGSQAFVPEARAARSDIDLRLVFPAGAEAWLRVNLLLIRLRSRALLGRVPLDLYAYDDLRALERFDQAEPMLVILDRDGALSRRFVSRHLIAA